MNAIKERLLIVEDDAGLRRQLAWSFSDYEVLTAESRTDAILLLNEHKPAVAVIDLGLPPDTQGAKEGLALLEVIRLELPTTKVIVLTGNEDRSHAWRAIQLGAFDFCSKATDIEILRIIVQRAFHLWRLEAELRSAGGDSDVLPGITTSSPEMINLCRIVNKVAKSDIGILLSGESGTGKEVFARAIHKGSERSNGPFIAINCGAIPENLLENELFGHEKGSFTGAIQQAIGKFEMAHKGTLLLDEIGDLPLMLQVKLLRFLQERTIERIGGRHPIAIDVRVICATHRDIPSLIAEQRFREDLYYRINEFGIRIPPLRDRGEDAVILARLFAEQYAVAHKQNVTGLTTDAEQAIASYKWPGNIRELQNKIKRAVIIAEWNLITAENLELGTLSMGQSAGIRSLTASDGRQLTLKEIRQNADYNAVKEILVEVNGNISKAAKILGISRPTLYELMRLHNLKM